jgi:hypothetical protein
VASRALSAAGVQRVVVGVKTSVTAAPLRGLTFLILDSGATVGHHECSE